MFSKANKVHRLLISECHLVNFNVKNKYYSEESHVFQRNESTISL